MKKLFTIVRLVLGIDLTTEQMKSIVRQWDEYDSFVVPSQMASVVEYIDELVMLNGLTQEHREYLMGKVRQYGINTLENDKLYIIILKFFANK